MRRDPEVEQDAGDPGDPDRVEEGAEIAEVTGDQPHPEGGCVAGGGRIPIDAHD
jgi:hypothetical protein